MSDNINTLNNNFEDSMEKSFKSLGYLFATSEDEVEYFETHNKLEEVPESFCSANEILSKSKHSIIKRKFVLDDNRSIENLARAARKGGDISEEILKKMKLDRDKAENGEK